MIFENSLPKRYFWLNKMEYEISFLSWDSRYFWSGALNNHCHTFYGESVQKSCSSLNKH